MEQTNRRFRVNSSRPPKCVCDGGTCAFHRSCRFTRRSHAACSDAKNRFRIRPNLLVQALRADSVEAGQRGIQQHFFARAPRQLTA